MITFVANDTPDQFHGITYPWISVTTPHLDSEGISYEVVSWRDQKVDWSQKRYIVIGPVWGYADHVQDFINWLSNLQSLSAKIYNSAKFLIWNVNKSYLVDLAKAGVPVPLTLCIKPSDDMSWSNLLRQVTESWGCKDFIIKPCIGASADGYKHIRLDTVNQTTEAHFTHLKYHKGGLVVQPFLPEVSTKGEFAFVFFNGEMSHAFIRMPKLGEECVQGSHGGQAFEIDFENPPAVIDAIKTFRDDTTLDIDDVRDMHQQALKIYQQLQKFWNERQIAAPLLIRLDLVRSGSQVVIGEVEGIEPYVRLDLNEAYAKKYARALISAYRNG